MWLLVMFGCAPEANHSADGVVSVASCADPSVRDSLGPFERVDVGGGWTEQTIPNGPFGAGIAVADFTGDGIVDIFLPGPGQDFLFVGDGQADFDDQSAQWLPRETNTGESASVVDMDADGDVDIYVGNHGPNVMLRNEGDHFVVVELGISGGDRYTTGSAWGDINRDGNLDLLVVNHQVHGVDVAAAQAGTMGPGDGNVLFFGDESGRFRDESGLLVGGALDGYSFAGALGDIDADGHADLYVVNDFGPYYAPNTALAWADGALVPVPQPGLDLAVFGMGLGWGHLAESTTPALFVPSWDRLSLLEYDEALGWYDSSAARGIFPSSEQHLGWGGTFADLDNDTDLDLTVAFGMLVMPEEERALIEENWGLLNPAGQPDAVFVQNEDGQFSDLAEAWGVADPGENRGTAVVDLNGDGWLDLVKRELFGVAQIYRARCGEAAWLGFELQQGGNNPRGVGATITISVDGRQQRQQVLAGGTDLSVGLPPVVHFGLGAAESAETVSVRWPDGEVTAASDIRANQVVVIAK